MRIIVVTGISGSGKSVALNVLEDSGYFCIDNLPAELLMAAARNAHERGIQRLAIATDIRSLTGEQTKMTVELQQAMQALRDWQDDVRLLFLSANTPTLIARYSESRRRHPLSVVSEDGKERNLEECIKLERNWMGTVYESSHVIDTSGLAVAALRHSVRQFAQATGAGITLTFESFGFKFSVPQDADLVFDARCLPNPHWKPNLRPLTGKDQDVIDFLEAEDAVNEMYHDIEQYMTRWLPRYQANNRSYITIAVGCTGGQHRSVYLSERLKAHFDDQYSDVQVRHRDIHKHKKN